ncbi:MAG: MerR family transcriptional regulator [Immundisolibacteraceae bacterium]|nr:MerR family transcriptional regulator [Immundisolibacteraceae bacterium]
MEERQQKATSGTDTAQDWFNTKQISSMLNLSSNVIRKMTSTYKLQLSNTLKKGKKNANLYNKDSLYCLRKIRELSLNGFTQQQIKEQLSGSSRLKQEDQAQQGSTKTQSNSTELSHHKRVVTGGEGQVKLKTLLRDFRSRLAQLEEKEQILIAEIDTLKVKNLSLEGDQNSKLEAMQKQIDLLNMSWWNKIKLKAFKGKK